MAASPTTCRLSKFSLKLRPDHASQPPVVIQRVSFGTDGRCLVLQCSDFVRVYEPFENAEEEEEDVRPRHRSKAMGPSLHRKKHCLAKFGARSAAAGLSGTMIMNNIYACGTSNGTVLLQNIKSRKVKPCELRGHANGVRVAVLAIGRDGRFAISSLQGPTSSPNARFYTIWDIGSRKKVATAPLPCPIWCADIDCQSSSAYCGAEGNLLRIDLPTARHTWKGSASHVGILTGVKVNSDSSKIISTSSNCVVVWDSKCDPSEPVPLHTLWGNGHPCEFGACVGERGSWVVTSCSNGTVQLWDSDRLVTSICMCKEPPPSEAAPLSLDVSRDGRLLAVSYQSMIRTFDMEQIRIEALDRTRDHVELASYIARALVLVV